MTMPWARLVGRGAGVAMRRRSHALLLSRSRPSRVMFASGPVGTRSPSHAALDGEARHQAGFGGVGRGRRAVSAAATATRKDVTVLVSTCESATRVLAQLLAYAADEGDCILLYGEVGSGKSHFSRAFVRAVVGDPDMTVPSPTFLLQQIYEGHDGPAVHHYDLYRLKGGAGGDDLSVLGLDESFSSAVTLVEWAERLDAMPGGGGGVGRRGACVPGEHLAISLRILAPEEQAGVEGALGAAAAGAEGDEGEGAAEDGCGLVDARWREVVLSGRGERWKETVEQVVQLAGRKGDKWGLRMLPESC